MRPTLNVNLVELITSTILKAAHEMSYPSICSFRERGRGEGGRGEGGREGTATGDHAIYKTRNTVTLCAHDSTTIVPVVRWVSHDISQCVSIHIRIVTMGGYTMCAVLYCSSHKVV